MILLLTLELRQVYSADLLAHFGAPQGLTTLITLKTFSKVIVEANSYQQRAQISEPGSSRELYPIRHMQTEQESEIFLLRGRMYEDVSVIHCHPKAPQHRQMQSKAGKRIHL